jgi:PAS domain S-box-containing protein
MDKKLLPIISSMVDMSDNFACEALRVSETRYRRLFETAQDGILLLNAETAHIEDVNPFLIKLLNYSYEEFLGKKLWDIGPFQDIKQTIDMFLEVQNNGYARYDDLPLKTSTGETIAVEFISNLYDVLGVNVIQCNIRDISDRKKLESVLSYHQEQLKIALMNTVEVATVICELRDPYTVGHEKRVAKIARVIGLELGFDQLRQEGLEIAGALHDIGKVSIPSEILSKPGKISHHEYQLIQAHAEIGYDILHRMTWPWPVAEVALQHHERIDGTGYPHGLKGEEILLESRIMAVADVVEAISSHRPYRPALGINKALAEIELGRGIKYDAVVVDACLSLFREKAFQIDE